MSCPQSLPYHRPANKADIPLEQTTALTPQPRPQIWRGVLLPASGAAKVDLPTDAGHIDVVRILVRNKLTPCLNTTIVRHYANHSRW